MAERTAARQTAADMGRSLGLVLLIVLVLLLVGPARTLIFPGDNKAAPVSYTDQAAGFTRLAHTRVVVPAALPSDWRANAADLSHTRRFGTRLHIGWVTPGQRFAGLDESDGDPTVLMRAVLGKAGATVVGSRSLGGGTWDLRRSSKGETALTRAFGAVTVVVTGSATGDQLDLLARSLH